MASAVVKAVPVDDDLVKELPTAASAVDGKEALLVGLDKVLPASPSDVAVKELPAAAYAVDGKEALLVRLDKVLPASPSDVAVKEFPAAASAVDGKEVLLDGVDKENPDAPSNVAVEELLATASSNDGKEVLLVGLDEENPDAPSDVAVKELDTAPTTASEKPVASDLRLLDTKGELSPRGDNSDGDASEKPSGKDTADDRLALDLPVANRHELDGPVRNRLALNHPGPKRFSTGALDLFEDPSRMLQVLGLMGSGGSASGTGFSGHGWWVSKEDDDAMQLKVEMPGLGKEHVKVTADKNILVIKGEGDMNPEDGKDPARYSRRIQLPAEAFKMDQIKAEMNNGVLKVTVPKIKDEERKDVFQIKVE